MHATVHVSATVELRPHGFKFDAAVTLVGAPQELRTALQAGLCPQHEFEPEPNHGLTLKLGVNPQDKPDQLIREKLIAFLDLAAAVGFEAISTCPLRDPMVRGWDIVLRRTK